MGRKIVLTGTTLTDTSAPRLAVIDPIESTGSLLLIEPANPVTPWAAGVPANSAVIPNLLKATRSMDDATFFTNGGLSGTKGLLERSGKGGLHGIVSQAVALASGDGARIRMGTATSAYLKTNTSNDYYFSIWDRLTRAVGSGTYVMDYATSNLGTAGIGGSSNIWRLPTGTVSLGQRDASNVVGGRFGNVAVDRSVSSGSVDQTSVPGWGASASSWGATNLAGANLKWSSFVFYRVYIEDLTVSGRTYAEVDAIDYALYTAAVLTPGGRYYGDTFTDPATIP